jgi:hypothetical protein
MVVVILIATGAAVCLKLYKAAENAGSGFLERVVFIIRQQAGVMAALAGTVFAVLTALQTGKVISVASASSTPSPPTPIFGANRPNGVSSPALQS